MNASEAALIAAHQIEDIFCQHHAGGRIQRVARIQVAICDAIARARADEVATTDPQPASSAAVQDEAAVIQGEDQRAQKGPGQESPPPAQASAGAAEEADVSCADPRNSSRPAGEVASAPLPVDRTEKKADRKPSQRERVLALWSTTDLSTEAIATEIGCAKSSIRAYISMAKADGDSRASARPPVAKAMHDDADDRIAVVLPAPTLIPRAAAASPAKRPASKPLDPAPGRKVGVVITNKGSVVEVDCINGIIRCPKGDWKTAVPVVLVMKKLRNGEMFDHALLAKIGSMGTETLFHAIPRWTAELASRGVELVSTRHVGCLIRRAEA